MARHGHVIDHQAVWGYDSRQGDGTRVVEIGPDEHAMVLMLSPAAKRRMLTALLSDDSVALELPLEALTELRRVWMTGDDAQLEGAAVRLLRDLFDGQDGHLRRIDDALGVQG